jgi:hypothetical protein
MLIYQCHANDLVHLPEEIAEFVQRIVGHLTHYQGLERRAIRRHRLAMPVVAVPLDDDLQPVGDTFAAVTRDISARGLALYHSRPVESPYLAVELADHEGQKLEAAVELLRCDPVDSFYEIAGTFVTKVYVPPIGPCLEELA